MIKKFMVCAENTLDFNHERFKYDPSDGELWIAEVNGKRVGSIAVVHDNARTAQLRWFILHPAYQGVGIGSKLIETALQYCKEQKFEQIYLWTISMLHAARHLYAKYGFIMIEEKENMEWCSKTLIEERWDYQLNVNKD